MTSRSLRSPPVARHVPLLGAIPFLVPRSLDYFVEAREACGDIFTVDLALMRLIVLTNPSHAQHVLRDRARSYGKGNAIWNTIRVLLGNGLPVSEGAFWLRQRRMIQPHFHSARLAAMSALMIEAIDEAMAGWDALATTGQPVDLAREMPRMTMRVIVKTMFGGQISSREVDAVGREMGFVIDYMLFGAISRNLPWWVPVPGQRRFEEAVKNIEEVLFRVLARTSDHPATEGGDLLGMLSGAVDAETGQRMNHREVRDEAIAIFLAGYETTSSALAFAFHYLSLHREVLEKLEAEICGAIAGRSPGPEDLPKLSYTLAVIRETLRLHSPTWWLPRTALQEDEIDGYHIPRGAEVAVMIHAIHRHPSFWDEPLRFNPERFSPEASAGRHPLAWLPFGFGPRKCVGQDFALMESQLVLARVLRRFRVRRVPGRTPATVHVGTTLRPQGGVWVHVSRRDPSSPCRTRGGIAVGTVD